MPSVRTFFIWISLSTFITACHSHVQSSLKRAESIMQEYPDSALTIINSIDTSKLQTKHLKADYALLHTMALDKTYIDVTDTMVLQPAITYYMLHGSSQKKAKVLYYKGIIHYRSKKFDSASVAFLSALRYAAKTDDSWLKGMICSALAWTYNKNHNNIEELNYSRQAYSHFLDYGDSLYIDSALYSQAVALHNNKHFAASDSLYALIPPNSKYYALSLMARADNEIKRPDRDGRKARQLFETAYNDGYRFDNHQLYSYAYALALTGDIPRAEKLMGDLESTHQDAITEWWQYSIRKAEGRHEEAFKHLEAYLYQQDSVVQAQLSQSIYKAENEHLLLVTEKAKTQKNKAIWTFTLSGFTAIALLLIVIIINLRRRIELQKEYSRVLNEYTEAKQLLARLKESNTGQLSSFAAIYKSQFARIGELFNKNVDFYYPFMEMPSYSITDVKNTIALISSPERQKELEERINDDLNGIMRKIRSDFPSLDNSAYRLICLVIIGIKDNNLASILNENPGTVRSRKSRLRKQILEADTPNHELYEAFLK